MEVEHIVVGAGAAGCALATRLSQVTDGPVLLLEAGDAAHDPRLHVPLAFARALRRPRLTWSYPVTVADDAETAGGADDEAWVRGRGLGGSTAVNGHLHLRPSAHDRDALAAAVDDLWWSADAQSAGLDAVEAPTRPDWRPGTGLPVHRPDVAGPVVDAVLAAAAADGVRVPADATGGPGSGAPGPGEHLRAYGAEHLREHAGEHLGVAPVTIHRGRRTTAARAFLPAAGTGLQVRTGVEVDRLLFDGDRVVGVRTVATTGRDRGEVVDHHARGEVVLCAGAIATPLLLQRSGIGPEAVLRAAGVPVRVVAERVGRGLVEPRASTVTVRLRDGLGRTPALATTPRRAAALARYALTRDGPLARAPFELAGSLAIGDDGPDAHLLVGTLCPDGSGLHPADHAGLIVQGYPARPTSPASVAITGADLGAAPRITAAHLATATDRRIAVGLVHRIRDWLATPPLRSLVARELLPGPEVTTDRQLAADVRRRGAGIYHAVGSCAAGTDPSSVVDPQLRVRGVTGLRVVDASVFPVTPAPGTAAVTAALAWRATELLRRTADR